jgi:hypothetical protein
VKIEYNIYIIYIPCKIDLNGEILDNPTKKKHSIQYSGYTTLIITLLTAREGRPYGKIGVKDFMKI